MGLIYPDACIWIYAIEQHEAFGARVTAAMQANARSRFAVSPLIKMECLVAPMRTGNLVLQRHYEAALAQCVQLPMREAVFLQATQLRARFGLRTPDALHLACAQVHACEALWTNDDRLLQASHRLARNVLG